MVYYFLTELIDFNLGDSSWHQTNAIGEEEPASHLREDQSLQMLASLIRKMSYGAFI